MEKKSENQAANTNRQTLPHDDMNDTDSRGTPVKRTDGPGPNDKGAGLMGEEAQDRLDRKKAPTQE